MRISIIDNLNNWFICIEGNAINIYDLFELSCYVSVSLAKFIALPFVIVIFYERIKSVWQYFMNL